MNLPDTVSVIVARPLSGGVADRLSVTLDSVVAFLLVGVDDGSLSLGEAMHMRTEPLSVGAPEHTQAHLPALSADGADHRWAVVFVRAMPALLVGAATRRVVWVGVALTFSPALKKHFVGLGPLVR